MAPIYIPIRLPQVGVDTVITLFETSTTARPCTIALQLALPTLMAAKRGSSDIFNSGIIVTGLRN
jgi:hypothetical protein